VTAAATVRCGRTATLPAMHVSSTRTGSRDDRIRAAETRIRWLAVLLDDLIEIPGTGRRIGLGPVVGLIPGVGDVIAAAPGAWLILEAARFRLPRVVLARMVANLVVDLIVGAVPLLGDLFDFGFKSNLRNLELFRRHASDPDASTRDHRLFLGGLLLVVVGAVLAVGWLFVSLLGWLDSFVIPIS
jgi:hypothetical protein